MLLDDEFDKSVFVDDVEFVEGADFEVVGVVDFVDVVDVVVDVDVGVVVESGTVVELAGEVQLKSEVSEADFEELLDDAAPDVVVVLIFDVFEFFSRLVPEVTGLDSAEPGSSSDEDVVVDAEESGVGDVALLPDFSSVGLSADSVGFGLRSEPHPGAASLGVFDSSPSEFVVAVFSSGLDFLDDFFEDFFEVAFSGAAAGAVFSSCASCHISSSEPFS
ncbi:hypothetical protein KF728_00110 [Candidatus Obscuribacterales bacterium]|nr:hypothetical protein [Candidatus Obscuribacterales bacterium]MBX3148526.1 hypothetical protein [Candidatus Obscuribacterales bacterium]